MLPPASREEAAMIQTEAYTGGQKLAAAGLIFGLALTVPLLGIIMIPVAAVGTVAKMVQAAREQDRVSA
jgi:uncharacterized protein involved in cysteine biosynthesis